MFLIVMGVSGSGKTTVGRRLAGVLGWPFYDGDDYHSTENVAKMAARIPLDDQDRAGWLQALAQIIQRGLAEGQNGVLACSALKKAYREVLQVDPHLVRFVYLRGDYDLILPRLQERPDHYMKAGLLQSQFADLEEPEDALTLDIHQPVEALVRAIVQKMVEP